MVIEKITIKKTSRFSLSGQFTYPFVFKKKKFTEKQLYFHFITNKNRTHWL